MKKIGDVKFFQKLDYFGKFNNMKSMSGGPNLR